MKRILNQLKSEYFSNISIQLAGTGIAQFIPFLVSPILARLYPETSFATFALFMALVAVLTVPNGGRYFYAMVIPEEDDEAFDLGKLSVWLVLLYNSFLFLLILVFYKQLNQFYKLNALWYIIPLYVAVFGIYNIALYLSVRQKLFKTNAFAKIVQTSSTAIFSIVLSFLGLIFSGLVMGKVVGVFTSIPFLKVKLNLSFDLDRLKTVAKKYIDYPKLTILPSLLDIFSVQALIFFVGNYYSQETLGYLGLTNMILIAPIALIGVSFRDVFYQKIAVFYNERSYERGRRLFLASAIILFAIGGIIAFTLFFFGEQIFSVIYGENWLPSGRFAAILGFAFWAKLWASPLSSIFNAAHQLKLLSVWQTFYFFTTVTTLYFAIVYFESSIEETLVIYTLHEILLYTLYFLMQKLVLRKFKTL